jgi:nitroreductase
MPWNFYFVENKKVIEELSTCKPHGAAFLANAPLAIVVTGDENKSDVWVEDCSIASINLQLTAQTLGLGSCWIQVRKRFYNNDVPSGEYIRKFFEFGEKEHVLSIIAVGYPAEERKGLNESMLNYNAVHDLK